MAKLLSTKSPTRIPVTSGVAYLVMSPSLYTAAKIDRAVRAQGAVRSGHLEVLAALEEGIKAILSGKDDAELREKQLAIVRDFRDWLIRDAMARKKDAFLDQKHEIHDLIRIVRPHYPKISQVEAEQEFYWTVYGIEACRHLLYGRETKDGEAEDVTVYERGPAGLSDQVLMAIPEDHRASLGLAIDALLKPSEAEAKNSDSPSPGPCTPETSTSAATAKTPPPKARSKATPGPSAKSASSD